MPNKVKEKMKINVNPCTLAMVKFLGKLFPF